MRELRKKALRAWRQGHAARLKACKRLVKAKDV